MFERTYDEHIFPITEFQRSDDCNLRRQPYLPKRFLRSFLFCVLTGVLLAGCVPSLYPFYKQGQEIFDKELVGEWNSKGGAVPGRWVFSHRADEASYWLEYTADDKTDVFRVRLFQIGKRRYLDLSLSGTNDDLELGDFAKTHLLFVHTLGQFSIDGDNATISFLDPQWIDKLLRKEPTALRHERCGRLLLTATTEELQNFVELHADDATAWQQKVPLERQAEQERAPNAKHRTD